MNLFSLISANFYFSSYFCFCFVFVFVFVLFNFFVFFVFIIFQDILFLHPDTAHAGGPNTSCEIRKMVYFRLKIKCGNMITSAMKKIIKKKSIKISDITSNFEEKISETLERDKISLIDDKDNWSGGDPNQNNTAGLNIDKFIDESMRNNNDENNVNNNDIIDNDNEVNISDITKKNIDEKHTKPDIISTSHALPSSTSIDTNYKSCLFVDWNSVTLAHSSDMWADLMGVKTLEGV